MNRPPRKPWPQIATLIVIATAGLSMAPGCETPAPEYNATEQAMLAKSREAWAAAKGRADRHYRYTEDFSSYPTTFYSTAIEVHGPDVVSRTYGTIGGDPGWVEDTSNLGTHQGRCSVAPLTMEQVYDDCASNLLTRDPAKYFIGLRLDATGILATCTASDMRLFDSCASGHEISSIEFLD